MLMQQFIILISMNTTTKYAYIQGVYNLFSEDVGSFITHVAMFDDHSQAAMYSGQRFLETAAMHFVDQQIDVLDVYSIADALGGTIDISQGNWELGIKSTTFACIKAVANMQQ